MVNEDYMEWLSELMTIAFTNELPYPTSVGMDMEDYLAFLYQDDLTPSEALDSLPFEEHFSS